ncbi:hypothetical protein [Actinacidiphila sp. ITFR-21]|uniref:hypothetical protein n=1 Tax=Actinacidiphila sp. ITFR-21 TaxID=3075199 RepID=UPI002889D0DE|nr:hypothetical protein [Streptomyces sp. ITFR-21]WNI15551.1 hypothetical protein RLT57_08445 [Streptomyces sp. ITFR-21]
MSVTHIVLTLVVGAAAVIVLMGTRGYRPVAPTPDAEPGHMVTATRYCPVELRSRTAVVHADGSAECLDCGTLILAREV